MYLIYQFLFSSKCLILACNTIFMLTKYKITWEFYNTHKELKIQKNRFKRWFKDFIDKYKIKIYIYYILYI